VAGITATAFAAATLVPFFYVNWRGNPLSYGLGSLMLASPFAVLFAGHVFVCRTWRRNSFLVLGILPLGFAWSLAFVAMLYFQPGWYGLFTFGVGLSLLSGLYLLASLLIREPAPESHAT
jgi:hypothetical protein